VIFTMNPSPMLDRVLDIFLWITPLQAVSVEAAEVPFPTLVSSNFSIQRRTIDHLTDFVVPTSWTTVIVCYLRITITLAIGPGITATIIHML